MRGSQRAIATRLPRAGPRRRWSSWITELIEERRRTTAERHEMIERLAHEQRRRARGRGPYIPEPKYRIRPW